MCPVSCISAKGFGRFPREKQMHKMAWSGSELLRHRGWTRKTKKVSNQWVVKKVTRLQLPMRERAECFRRAVKGVLMMMKRCAKAEGGRGSAASLPTWWSLSPPAKSVGRVYMARNSTGMNWGENDRSGEGETSIVNYWGCSEQLEKKNQKQPGPCRWLQNLRRHMIKVAETNSGPDIRKKLVIGSRTQGCFIFCNEEMVSVATATKSDTQCRGNAFPISIVWVEGR